MDSERGVRRFAHEPSLERLKIVRLTSLFFGLLAVALSYRAVRRALDSPEWALLAAAFLAFNPQFLFLSGVVSNDTAAAAIGAAGLLVVAEAIRGQATQRRIYLGLAAVVALGVLTKTSTLAGLAAAGFTVLALDERTLRDRRIDIALSGVVFFALTGPILVWNTLNRGDPLGMQAVWESAAHLPGPDHWGGLVRWFGTRYWLWTFESYWARFGWMNLAPPLALYGFYGLLSGGGLAGAVWAGRRGDASAGMKKAGQRNLESPNLSPLVIYFGLAIALTLISHVWINLWVAQAQGRHFFAVAPQISALLAVGWAMWIERIPGRTIMGVSPRGLATLLTLPAAYCLFRIISAGYA